MNEIIFLVEPDPEGGYTAQALGYSIFTEADTWDELKIAVQDAVRCHLEEDERVVIGEGSLALEKENPHGPHRPCG